MKTISLALSGMVLMAMGCGGNILNPDTDENLDAIVSSDIMKQVKIIEINDSCSVYLTNPMVEYNGNWFDTTPNGYYICGGVMALYDSCPSFRKMEFGLIGQNQANNVKDFNSYPANWIDSPPPAYAGEVSYKYREVCSYKQNKLSDFSGEWKIKATVKYFDKTTYQVATQIVESDTVAFDQMMVMSAENNYSFPYDQVAQQLYGYGNGMPGTSESLQPVGQGTLYHWNWGTYGECQAFAAGPYVERNSDGDWVCGGGYVKGCQGADLKATVSTTDKDNKWKYYTEQTTAGVWIESCVPITWDLGNDWFVVVRVNDHRLEQPGIKLSDMYNYGESEFPYSYWTK